MRLVSTDSNSQFDVAIIGSGPSGSIAAKKLAEKGLDVIILDRKMEIGAPDMCSDLINRRIIRSTGVDETGVVLDKIERIQVSSSGTDASFFMQRSNRSDAFNTIIAGDRFQKELAGLAANAGSRIAIRSEVKGITAVDDLFHLNFTETGKERSLKARYVLNASGGVFGDESGKVYPGGQQMDEFTFRYRRAVRSKKHGTESRIAIGGKTEPLLTYNVPIEGSWVDEISIQPGNEMNVQMGDFEETCVTSGKVHVKMPSTPFLGNGKLLNLGVSAGLFDHFFFTGYNEAFFSGIAAVDFIIATENSGTEAQKNTYETFLGKDVLENTILSERLFHAISACDEKMLTGFVQYLSDYEFEEISLNEIMKKTKLSAESLLNILGSKS